MEFQSNQMLASQPRVDAVAVAEALQISTDHARLVLDTLASVLHSESSPLVKAQPGEIDSVGADSRDLILFLYMQSYKKLLPRTHKDSAAVADVWPSTSAFDGYLSALSPLQFEDCTFDWLYWPQAKQPYSAKVIDYINSLDAEFDIALLQFHGWNIPPQCARTLQISTMLLKKGVARGLTLFDIGSVMCRETVHKESMIEEIVREAEDCLIPGMSEAAFLETVSEIMDSRLNNKFSK